MRRDEEDACIPTTPGRHDNPLDEWSSGRQAECGAACLSS